MKESNNDDSVSNMVTSSLNLNTYLGFLVNLKLAGNFDPFNKYNPACENLLLKAFVRILNVAVSKFTILATVIIRDVMD